MDSELAAARRETDRLIRQARSARRALRALQDAHGRRLGAFELAPGEPLDEREVIDFLRLAIGGTQQEVQITVTAREGTDQGEDTP